MRGELNEGEVLNLDSSNFNFKYQTLLLQHYNIQNVVVHVVSK